MADALLVRVSTSRSAMHLNPFDQWNQIYRCYAIWSRSIWIILLPCAFLTGASSGLSLSLSFSKGLTDGLVLSAFGATFLPKPPAKITLSKYIYMWLTLSINVSVTALIGEILRRFVYVFKTDVPTSYSLLEPLASGGWPAKHANFWVLIQFANIIPPWQLCMRIKHTLHEFASTDL